jgi:hypothetical protein
MTKIFRKVVNAIGEEFITTSFSSQMHFRENLDYPLFQVTNFFLNVRVTLLLIKTQTLMAFKL